VQEISEMLGGRMSNQDEDEVEDELDALEAEVSGKTGLPDAPTEMPEPAEEVKPETPRERARRRQREQETALAAEPVLA
jgi:charged multivesicular body protein 6